MRGMITSKKTLSVFSGTEVDIKMFMIMTTTIYHTLQTMTIARK